MTRIIEWAAAALMLAVPAAGLGQEVPAAGIERPRVELGAGIGGIVTWDGGFSMIDTRVGVRLSRHWSIEGLWQFSRPDTWGSEGYYRAQALWRKGASVNQLLAGFGVAGYFERWKRPEYRVVWDGTEYYSPAASGFDIHGPTYPTATIGYERILASHLALRLELTAAVAFGEGGADLGLLPAAGVTIPLGHYKVRQ